MYQVYNNFLLIIDKLCFFINKVKFRSESKNIEELNNYLNGWLN